MEKITLGVPDMVVMGIFKGFFYPVDQLFTAQNVRPNNNKYLLTTANVRVI